MGGGLVFAHGTKFKILKTNYVNLLENEKILGQDTITQIVPISFRL